MIRGSVDTVSSKRVTGWIYSDGSAEPLWVEVMLDGQIIGKAVANMLRPDLAAAGLGDGKCGFEIRFANEIDALYLPFAQVMLAGTDLELRRWAGAGFRDYFRALYLRYPRAGRAASVFGGLWTDRTDAAALLKGRADIGMVATAAANCLARFIQDGVVIVVLDAARAAPGDGAKAFEPSAEAAESLFDDGVLKVTRAILDDHPVAVRADSVNIDEDAFLQMSTLEDLPSPAECLGLVFPAEEEAIAVEVIRGGHRFPEFLPDGSSRWTHVAGQRKANGPLSPDLMVDRHAVVPGSVIMIGPGTLFRIRAATHGAVRLLVLPARLSSLRFHQTKPRGEITHNSGARIWV